MDYKKILWVSSLTAVSAVREVLDSKLEYNYAKLVTKEIEYNDELFWNTICPKRKSLAGNQKASIDYFAMRFLSKHERVQYINAVSKLKKSKSSVGDILNEDFFNMVSMSPETLEKKRKDIDRSAYKKLVYRFRFFWKNNSFYAYQLANAIVLTRWAGIIEVFTRAEVLKILDEIGDLILANYPSYEVFGMNATMSHELIRENPEIGNLVNGFSVEFINLEIIYHTLWSHIEWGGIQNRKLT
ncbi:MAG: DUF1266 domain-containing protein [Tissierellales bacterium]|nr:DUF1266 domain-containing protein [Tissierellales bacterium]